MVHRMVITDFWPFAGARSACLEMVRTIKRGTVEDGITALGWTLGRIVHLEAELSVARAELARVREDAASRIQAAQIDEAHYQRLLELERRTRAAGWTTEIDPHLEAKLDAARPLVSELGDGFRVPPPGTFGPGDYGPDSFGGSDY